VVLLTAAAAPPRVAAMYTNVDVMAALIADTKHYESAFMESVGEMREYESKFARIVKCREAAQAAQAQAAQAAHHNHPSAATRLVRSGARLPLRRIPVDASASRLVGRKLTQDDPAVVGVADPLKPANVPVLAGADGGGGGAGARARNVRAISRLPVSLKSRATTTGSLCPLLATADAPSHPSAGGSRFDHTGQLAAAAQGCLV
jgi:hypothetical protein